MKRMPPRTREMSARELEVLTKLCEGKPDKAIAGELGISVDTVKAHNYNIRNKCGMTTRVEIVTWAIAKGHYTP